jgi:hypothetical protein
MGIRFYRRFRLMPGVSLNLSKRGASVSLGPKGAHVTIGTSGATETVGLPGTGVYYTAHQGRRRRGQGPTPPANALTPSQWWAQFFFWLAAYFAAFAIVIAMLGWRLG